MGVTFYPGASGGGVKSVQRGTAAGAGNVTITAVDISKTMIRSYSKGSSGSVAARGTGTGNWQITQNTTQLSTNPIELSSYYTFSIPLTAGSTDLTAKTEGAKLVNSTTINCSGACEWEVIEFQ